MLIWLRHGLNPSDIHKAIQDATFRKNFLSYLEDIVKESLDEFEDVKKEFETIANEKSKCENEHEIRNENFENICNFIGIT